MDRRIRKEGKQELLQTFYVIAILLVYLFIRIFIVRLTGMQGSAYLFSSLELVLFFILLFPYALSNILTQQVKKRVELEQYRNAKHMYNSAMFMVIVYAIFITLILFCASKFFSNQILLGDRCRLSLLILSPILLFHSISLIIRGYLNGIYSHKISVISNLIEVIVMLISVLIFSRLLISYGTAVSVVLLNIENKYAFGAGGSAIGIVAGNAIGLVLCILLLAGSKKEIRKKIRRDPTKRKEDITGLFRLLIGFTLPEALSLLLLNSHQLVAQWFYSSQLKNTTEDVLLSYQWGAYAGIFQSVLFLPLIMVYALCYKEYSALNIGMENGDLHEVRIKAQGMLKDSILIVFLCVSFAIVMARPIATGIFATESDLVVSLIRFGSVAMIFMAYAIASVIVLSGTGNSMSNLINGAIAFVVHILLLFYTCKIAHLGIYGVLIAFIVFSIIFSVLNCIALMRVIHYRFDWKKMLMLPTISAIATGIITLLLNLLFRLFLPPVLCVIIIFPIAFLAYFIALVLLGEITPYSVSGFPMGKLLLKLGKILRIFR